MSSRVKEASCSSDQAADHSSALGGGQQKCEREHEHEHEHGHGHEHEHGHGQEQSRIPILMSSPSHLRRTGSLKLRSEIRWTQRQGDAGASTPSQPLRRHRSLHGLTSPIPSRRQIEANCDRGRGRGSDRDRDRDRDRDDDLDSERSFGSSCNSSLCGHSPFAHNGTTYSARNMKYVFHCSPSTATDEYLTPTQRANRTIKRLRRMLADTQAELLEKDNEIGRLTKEIVELRLLKADSSTDENASCTRLDSEFNLAEPVFNKSGPRLMDVLLEERDGSSVSEEQRAGQPFSHQFSDNLSKSIFARQVHHSPSSLADSGHFDDTNVVHSLEKEIERLRENYDDTREKHNEKVEQLLKIIADSNDRYYELKPKYDSASIRMKELEKEIETLKAASSNGDELQKNIDLQLYAKQSNSADQVWVRGEDNSSATEETNPNQRQHYDEVADLLKTLLVTKKELENVKDIEFKNNTMLSAREAISLWILGTRKVMYRALLDASKLKAGNDAEMTLRFLKTAIFYFLTDTTNSRDHLAAIESILGYSDDEKAKIEKVQGWKY